MITKCKKALVGSERPFQTTNDNHQDTRFSPVSKPVLASISDALTSDPGGHIPLIAAGMVLIGVAMAVISGNLPGGAL